MFGTLRSLVLVAIQHGLVLVHNESAFCLVYHIRLLSHMHVGMCRDMLQLQLQKKKIQKIEQTLPVAINCAAIFMQSPTKSGRAVRSAQSLQRKDSMAWKNPTKFIIEVCVQRMAGAYKFQLCLGKRFVIKVEASIKQHT